jgi:hypothetical protein
MMCEINLTSNMIKDYIVLSDQSNPIHHYNRTLQAGLNKHFGERVRHTEMENLFQAMEFKRFGLLDDYIYHLEMCLALPLLPNHLELCCEAVCLLTMRILFDYKNKSSIELPTHLLRYFDVR